MKARILAVLIMVVVLASLGVYAQEDDEECLDGACIGDDANSSAVPVYFCEVEVNGDEVFEDKTIRLGLERGDEIEVKIRLTASEDAKDVQIQAMILGYEHGFLADVTSPFDMKEDTSYSKRLSLRIPDDLEVNEYNEGEYKLRVIIADRDGSTLRYDFNLQFEASRHGVVIRDILLDPSDEVMAGRGLLASVRVKNTGQRDEDDGLKITVSVPALGLKATDYIDELEVDESTTSEDLFLRIPRCEKPGTYVVRAEVEFNDGYDTVTEETSIDVVEDPACEMEDDDDDDNGTPGSERPSRTVITVPKSQDVTKGTAGSVFPIMISNTGATSKQYTLSVSGVDAWGTYRLEGGALVIVGPRATETRYLYVTAKNDAPEGPKVFVVNIESGEESESIALTANVLKGNEGKDSASPITGDWGNIKNGLTIGLIALAVLIVILVLIVGYQKLRGGGDDDDDVSGQTYY